MKKFLDDFLPNVAYPAVAGNIAWSFATLAIDLGLNCETAPRLGVLLVLAIYFSAEWYRSKGIATTIEGQWLDLFFIICIIWFAIGTQANKGIPGAALIVILLSIGLGHLFKFWPPNGKGKGNSPHGAVSLVAGIILGVSWCLTNSWNHWLELLAIVIVLGVWACVRWGVTK